MAAHGLVAPPPPPHQQMLFDLQGMQLSASELPVAAPVTTTTAATAMAVSAAAAATAANNAIESGDQLFANMTSGKTFGKDGRVRGKR